MKQKQIVEFSSEDTKIKLQCDTDTPLGSLHDFLMLLKGNIVDRMIAAQKEEELISEKQKNMSEEE